MYVSGWMAVYYDLSDEFQLDKNKRHSIEAVVDRLLIDAETDAGRVTDSIETALRLGDGVVLVDLVDGEELLFSEHFACVHCGVSLGEIAPRTFSFNSPHGACPECTGLGNKLEIDPDQVIPDKGLTLSKGAIKPWSRALSYYSLLYSLLESVAQRHGFSVNTPIKDLSEDHLRILLYGDNGEDLLCNYRDSYGRYQQHYTGYEGVIPNLERRYRETESDYIRTEIERYMTSRPCPSCQGKRLKPESLAVTVDGKNIIEVSSMSVTEASKWAG